MKRLKFILIDDNDAFRKALRMILVNMHNAEILDEASNAEDVLKMENLASADIILMDLMMPGKNGIELTKELLWIRHNLKIIAITLHVDKVYLTSLIEAGFKGCIFKNNLVDHLNQAIDVVTNGGLFFPKEILLGMHKIKG